MAFELIYTSLPRGLQTGSVGFCTVAMSRNMPNQMVQLLESLTGYRPLYPPLDPNAAYNPVSFCHYRANLAGRTFHILGRVASAGLDYSGRTNKFAHFVVLNPDELPPGGPAWLLLQPGFLETAWQGEPRYLETPKYVPMGNTSPRVATTWQALTGDAGWGGLLVEKYRENPTHSTILMVPPGNDLLPAFDESLALLPARDRWEISFNTYFMSVPPGMSCTWRGMIAGSPEAKEFRRASNQFVILMEGNSGPAVGGALTQAARTGQVSTESYAVAEPPATLGVPTSLPSTLLPLSPVIPSERGTGTLRLAELQVRAEPELLPTSPTPGRRPAPMPSYLEEPKPRNLLLPMFFGMLFGMLLAFMGVILIEIGIDGGIATQLGLTKTKMGEIPKPKGVAKVDERPIPLVRPNPIPEKREEQEEKTPPKKEEKKPPEKKEPKKEEKKEEKPPEKKEEKKEVPKEKKKEVPKEVVTPKPVEKAEYVRLPELGGDLPVTVIDAKTLKSWKLGNVTGIRLLGLPEDKEDPSLFFARPDGSKCLLEIPRNIGSDQTDPLGELRIEGKGNEQQLVLFWTPDVNAGVAKRDERYKRIGTSILRLQDESGTIRYAYFFPPEKPQADLLTAKTAPSTDHFENDKHHQQYRSPEKSIKLSECPLKGIEYRLEKVEFEVKRLGANGKVEPAQIITNKELTNGKYSHKPPEKANDEEKNAFRGDSLEIKLEEIRLKGQPVTVVRWNLTSSGQKLDKAVPISNPAAIKKYREENKDALEQRKPNEISATLVNLEVDGILKDTTDPKHKNDIIIPYVRYKK